MAKEQNKDIKNLDIGELVEELLTPIDKIRSQTKTDGFLESRANAFYRMIGFPVSSNGSNFYSPGYNLNSNLNISTTQKQNQINKDVINNKSLTTQQFDKRERSFKNFSKIFSAGGFNATALTLGSIFIRSFERQFSGTGPFEFDANQIQAVSQRNSELFDFYNTTDEIINSFNELTNSGNLFSTHLLKPFIVDPRIQIVPDENLVAAPFLKDASQLSKFDSSPYPRPYLERVISIRFNNQNITGKSPNINDIIDDIKNDQTVVDAYLLSVANSPFKEMQTSDVVIFGSYLKLIRSVINTLVSSIKDILDVKKSINLQPVPDARAGVEGTLTLAQIDSLDPNNTKTELKIIELLRKISLEQSSHFSDIGTDGVVDVGGFVFSGLDDIIFAADKVSQVSNQKEFDELKSLREAAGKVALDEIKTIEYIMGEFSGLGLIDVIAIQSAFWLMDKSKLLGLIDEEAYQRIKDFRTNLNVSSIDRTSDLATCLTEFEAKLKEVYQIIQLYFDQVWNGKAFNSL